MPATYDRTTWPAYADLSAEAEQLLNRLTMKADDHGRYFGSAAILGSLCFPFRLRQNPRRIENHLEELEECGLIVRYVTDRALLAIVDFDPPINPEDFRFSAPEHMEHNWMPRTGDIPPEQPALSTRKAPDDLGKTLEFIRQKVEQVPKVKRVRSKIEKLISRLREPVTRDERDKLLREIQNLSEEYLSIALPYCNKFRREAGLEEVEP